MCIFFFNDTATTEIYTLSLHDALPICFVSGAMAKAGKGLLEGTLQAGTSAVSDKLQRTFKKDRKSGSAGMPRPISYAVFCLKKKEGTIQSESRLRVCAGPHSPHIATVD